MEVATVTVTMDSQIGYIADFIPEQISSNVGLVFFILIAVIFTITQYFILEYIKQSNKENRVYNHLMILKAQGCMYNLLRVIYITQQDDENIQEDRMLKSPLLPSI
jgi:hypothetical protein